MISTILFVFIVTSLLSAPLGSLISTSADHREMFFRESGDVGVSKCSMPGRFGRHHATLNIWIRAVVKVSKNASSMVEIKGFAFMESLAQPWFGPQILNGGKSYPWTWLCAWPHACYHSVLWTRSNCTLQRLLCKISLMRFSSGVAWQGEQCTSYMCWPRSGEKIFKFVLENPVTSMVEKHFMLSIYILSLFVRPRMSSKLRKLRIVKKSTGLRNKVCARMTVLEVEVCLWRWWDLKQHSENIGNNPQCPSPWSSHIPVRVLSSS